MAAVAPPKPTEHFSLSKIISRFGLKKGKSKPAQTADSRPPLKGSPLPLVLPQHQPVLSQLGWTVVTFPQPALAGPAQKTEEPVEQGVSGLHPLQSAYQDLFQASAAFFDLPDEEKEKWKTRLGSEEGWSKIPGEKEFITLRTLSYTPHILRPAAKRFWDLMGAYLDTCLGRINATVGLADGEAEGLRQYVGPCKTLGENEEDKTATMLRLFRYEGWDEKVVAEPHADLGLLSCVVGDVPGLEVWNGREYVAIEKDYQTPCATLLGGRQLQRLTNWRYPAGGHRVVSYGALPPDPSLSTDDTKAKYRFSIVFVLRAHEPVEVDTDLLTTEITGAWQQPIKNKTAGQMYAEIRGAHFNINTGMQERDEQRRKLAESKKANVGKTPR